MNPKLRKHRRFQLFRGSTGALMALLPLLLVLPAQAADAARRTLGRVEQVHLVEPGVVMKARIDTGARSTSVDATIVEVIPGVTTGSTISWNGKWSAGPGSRARARTR
jgi:hypothetical protein